jgi:hypothetical protein
VASAIGWFACLGTHEIHALQVDNTPFSPFGYQRHRRESTLLYQLVSSNSESLNGPACFKGIARPMLDRNRNAALMSLMSERVLRAAMDNNCAEVV